MVLKCDSQGLCTLLPSCGTGGLEDPSEDAEDSGTKSVLLSHAAQTEHSTAVRSHTLLNIPNDFLDSVLNTHMLLNSWVSAFMLYYSFFCLHFFAS